MAAPAHSDRGLKRLLTFPQVYTLFGRLIRHEGTAPSIFDKHVQPFAGARILDLGCGAGRAVGHLPDSVEYCGVDFNPAYIESARERWQGRAATTFMCADVAATGIPHHAFDIVMCIALLHHLDDAAADSVLRLGHDALVPGGRLVTWDGVYRPGQPRFARWLISMDRGRAVRTEDGYRALAERRFAHVESRIVTNTLRVPYTICAMTCTKEKML